MVDQYGKGSLYHKPDKKPQLTFFYDNEQGVKKRKTLSIPEGADPQQIKLEFIVQTLTKRYQLQQEQKKRQLLQETISKDFLEKVDKIVEALPETKKTLKPCNKTVAQVLDEYLKVYEAKKVQYCTYTMYNTFTNKIKELIGDKKIAELQQQDVQYLLYNIQNKENGEALSKDYVRGLRCFFTRALKFAKKQQYISTYTVLIEDLENQQNLKESNPDERFLDYEELAKVLFSFRNNMRYYTIYRLLAITGMRVQELFALRKQDIDYRKHCLHINQALKMDKGRNFVVGKTKTKNSVRVIPATDTVFNLINEWLKYAEEQGINKLAEEKGNGDLIFTDINGSILKRNSVSIDILRFQKRYPEVPHVSFHMMRHCFATYLDREECPIRLIQQVLGHSLKRNSITEIHYIAPNPNYVELARPYVQIVDDKIDKAYNIYEAAYIRRLIEKGEQ